MDIDDVIDLVRGWDGVAAVTPEPGSGAPEIAWGDTFFYYSPDGTIPTTGQPFATIVTKNYPDDETSGLDRPGAFRVNLAAGRAAIAGFVDDGGATHDPTEMDRIFVHPVYGRMGWLAVINPGPRASEATRALLRQAYEAARARHDRREGL
jgi:hypothetical protein